MVCYLYIIECNNGAYYTGVTNDIQKRLNQHKTGVGARYTKQYGVKELAYVRPCKNKSEAMKLEYAVKQLGRGLKEKLINGSLTTNKVIQCIKD